MIQRENSSRNVLTNSKWSYRERSSELLPQDHRFLGRPDLKGPYCPRNPDCLRTCIPSLLAELFRYDSVEYNIMLHVKSRSFGLENFR